MLFIVWYSKFVHYHGKETSIPICDLCMSHVEELKFALQRQYS